VILTPRNLIRRPSTKTTAILRERFSSKGFLQIFVYCAFPIHLWTILNMLRDVPSWAFYMRYGELFSSIAYTMSFALIETLILFLPVVVLGMLLPKRWVRDKFVPLVSVLLLEASLAAPSPDRGEPHSLACGGDISRLVGTHDGEGLRFGHVG
jgi:hypothetical protein